MSLREHEPQSFRTGAASQHDLTGTTRESQPPRPFVVRALRILVIDAYQPLADGLHKLLRDDGWRAAKAYDGIEGLTLAALFRPDVVICDLQLRGSPDAHEVALCLRASLSGGPIHLVGLTTARLPRNRSVTGFDEILRKPFGFKQIDTILASLC